MALTEKELSGAEDLLSMEKLMVSKCETYAQQCDDPQLKEKFENMAGKHKTHYDRLFTLLN